MCYWLRLISFLESNLFIKCVILKAKFSNECISHTRIDEVLLKYNIIRILKVEFLVKVKYSAFYTIFFIIIKCSCVF